MNIKSEFIKNEKIIGGHVSISGGIYMAPERASQFCFSAFQIFVKNGRQWNTNNNLDNKDILQFKENIKKFDIKNTVAHATYLINLGSQNPEVVEKSKLDIKNEVKMCNDLGINYLVIHPGSAENHNNAIHNIMDFLNSLDTGDTSILIENSSGKGNTLPGSIDEMASMMDMAKNRIYLCLDVCHFYAYGYDITKNYNDVMSTLNDKVGYSKIKTIHLNDSKYKLGEKGDRHENIGYGYIGDSGFYNIINDNNLNNIPMIMETPDGDEYYKANLERLLGLMGGNVEHK
ncbi:hypothetical protein SE19_06245 [Acidiplasma aeolicum]|nr:hypothetical protein SE19_06245 [Acidiplasma aeolicum]